MNEQNKKSEKYFKKPLITLLNSLNYESDRVTFTRSDYKNINEKKSSKEMKIKTLNKMDVFDDF
jgi:hypothetical protein